MDRFRVRYDLPKVVSYLMFLRERLRWGQSCRSSVSASLDSIDPFPAVESPNRLASRW